ncbi:MAG: hypothetical protein LBD89_00355 [Tannerellaceae bacterium]|jgi:hypothetical protein|nr:hypothetical protein [Tannerellaceae bacterium]
MKRILSLVLICLLSATALQPVVAFHFCRGRLLSVGIGGPGASCCGGAMAETGDEGASALGTFATPCCSEFSLEIATDTFRLPVSFVLPAPDMPGGGWPFGGLCCPLPGGDGALTFIFPPIPLPGHPTSLSAGFLALLCVRRI